MARIRFTNLALKRMQRLAKQDGRAQVEFSDSEVPGFLAVVSGKTGRITFCLRHRDPALPATRSPHHKLKLGIYPSTTLAQARERALAARSLLDRGVNPSREAVEGREQTLTFAQVADRYERDFVASELAATTAQEYRRLLRKEVLPNLGRLPANSIGRQDVVLLLDRIKKRGPVLANRVQALISGVFRFAIEQELAKENPCVGIRRRTKERKTGRALSMHDLGRIWRALETESVLMRSIFRFILLTGQRGRTVTRFAREQIRQTEHGLVWEVPPEITKKDRPHVLPLLPVALEQVEALDGVSALVFPSPRGAGALSLKALAHAAARIRRRGKVPLRVKDLRTTVATRLGEFGTTRHIRRLILAHKDPSILAHYDLYSYLPQMRDALATWEARVTEAVAEKS